MGSQWNPGAVDRQGADPPLNTVRGGRRREYLSGDEHAAAKLTAGGFGR
jgi:hypothetical protein